MNGAARNRRIGALLLVAAVGCGQTSDTAQVSGMITVGGRPLEGGAANFFPAAGGRPIGAVVDASGNYQVDLPPGAYTVVAQASAQFPEGWQEGDPLPPPPAVQVPRRFHLPNSSPWKLTVDTPGKLEQDFDAN